MPSPTDLPRYRTLLVAVDRGVATITLNRPRQRNAVGNGMREPGTAPTEMDRPSLTRARY